ncbi:hypothetical protein [Halorussus sp. AFM4]|uniref:hypothetical protein n=1 Tax=Halorussus sp. AFM4 TaxID=3421651 RepID=UPI003EB84423
MASESDIQQLTEFEENDDIEDLADRSPDDAVEFDLYYDGRVVNPWSKGPNELVRLYFNDDADDDVYVPIDFAERIEEDVRSTPIGRPMADDDDDQSRDDPASWDDLSADYRVEQDAVIGDHRFDLLWRGEGDDESVVVAAEFDGETA